MKSMHMHQMGYFKKKAGLHAAFVSVSADTYCKERGKGLGD